MNAAYVHILIEVVGIAGYFMLGLGAIDDDQSPVPWWAVAVILGALSVGVSL